MKLLLEIARRIDAINEAIGRAAAWLVVVAVAVSAGNALFRYALNMGSNAWLELQWYLFAAVFLLGAAWTLRRNEHIRIDVAVSRLSPRVHAWIDIFGGLFFLLPTCLVILASAIPFAIDSFQSGEVSTNAGGLIIWPAKILIPCGFILLTLQAFSEIVKRFAYLVGLIDCAEFEKGYQHQSIDSDGTAVTH
ncbi:MAG: TRAP transporter small permease subunit [Rhodocyclaceae bacterium]|nr:TRAP transporter small permease subunit [Rhodocyclaceae bacterium]